MKRTIALVLVGIAASSGSAQEAPSYAKHIRPFLAKYCLECHNAKSSKGGLDLETVKAMLEGSNKGEVLHPGIPERSKLVLLLETKDKTVMPPKTAKFHPKADEIALVRTWVKAGAKDDSGTIKVVIPNIKPRVPTVAPITALAFHPDGRRLAVAQHETIRIVDVVSGKEDLVYTHKGLIGGLTFDAVGQNLAVAFGKPGASGSYFTHALSPKDQAGDRAPATLDDSREHKDAILDLAYSPDGRRLATASYDTKINVIGINGGKDRDVASRMLHEHSDAVFGVAFSPDSKLLASCSADRAVKVYDVASGKLLYTLGEATDWLYTLAWAPDGKHLASGGVDKSIRIYRVDESGGKIVHSVFAHEAPLQKVIFSKDSLTLYSLGQDGVVKSWDASQMVERKVYGRRADTGLAMAVGATDIAIGRYDGVVELIDIASGKARNLSVANKANAAASGEIQQVAAVQPAVEKKTPAVEVAKVTPNSGPRDVPLRLTIEGKHLDQLAAIEAAHPGTKASVLRVTPTSALVEVLFPPTTNAGVYPLQLKTKTGAMKPISFTVDLFAAVAPAEGNDSPGTGQLVTLPASIAGKLDKTGDVDFYRFEVKKGQQLGVQALTAVVGSKMEPLLQLTDQRGKVLVESISGNLGHTFAEPGTYALGVRDREFRGGGEMFYRLHLGDVPIVTSLFPLGMQRGQEADIRVKGVFLTTETVCVKVPADAALGSKVRVPVMSSRGQPLGNLEIVVGEHPEVLTAFKPSVTESVLEGTIAVPGTANGYLQNPGQSDQWKFSAKKGQRLVLEVNARRLGGGLDSIIEVLDAKGQPVPRAVLRCQAKTFVTFRDHDSAQGSIRIEAWGELAINDMLLVGAELMKIKELPTHPDADCNFFTAAGQRTGYLDTTPTHHSLNEPMYKVSIHPPGSTFPPNGYPVFTLGYRNDDGGPGFGRDSRLFFDPPADGDYQVRITDSRGQSGDNFGYRLTVRPPRPGFAARFTPTSLAVPRGGALSIGVTADRIDGYEGPIQVEFTDLPAGFSAPAATIEAGQTTTALAVFAAADAKAPAKPAPIKLIASAEIAGKKQVTEAAGDVAQIIDPGEIFTTTEEPEALLRPGGQTKLTVRVERRQGFAGRIPLEVRGLPHGTRVLDIGLNGILVNENETRRTIVIYAEPWVAAANHPIVILAKREGKNSEHAAKSVMLRIGGK